MNFGVTKSSNNKVAKTGFLAALLLWLSLACPALASQSVTLTWDASTSTTLAGYRIHYGTASGVYTKSVDVTNTTTTTIDGLSEGKTYYFAVTAIDLSGEESDYTDEIIFTAPGILILTRDNTPGGMVHVRFPAAIGKVYSVQTSEDLKTWTTAFEVIAPSNGWMDFRDPESKMLPRRFYRLVLN